MPTIQATDLQTIPGIGPSMAQDLVDLGYGAVRDLEGAEPEEMFDRLRAARGGYMDRCVLYVFRCAVYYANNTNHEPELLKWWNWKDPK